jgi:type IV pilus secretin PilQ/predicted competence protein
MREPSVFGLVPFGVLLAILSGPAGAGTAASTAQPRPGALQVPSPTSNAQPATNRKTGDHESLAAVSNVMVQSGGAGKTWIDIATTVPAAYHVEHMDHPWRVVVDVKNSRDRTPKHLYTVQSPVLEQVKVQQYRAEPSSHVVRVVAILVGDTAFDVHPRPGGVRIELEARPRVSDVGSPVKPRPHQERSLLQSPASPPVSSVPPGRITKSGSAPSKPQLSDSGVRAKAKEQSTVQSEVAQESRPTKPGPIASAQSGQAVASGVGANAKPPLVAKVATPSRPESRVASPSPLGLKSSTLAAVPPQPTHPIVPTKPRSTSPPKPVRADASGAGANAKPPLVAKTATPERPESQVASSSRSGAKPTTPAAAASQPTRKSASAKSGSSAPKEAWQANIASLATEANGSRTAGPLSTPVAQAVTSSGPGFQIPSLASPGPKLTIPSGAATLPMPAPQVALAQTGEVAPPRSQASTDSGAATASEGQTFGPEPIAQVAALTPARDVAPANPAPVVPTEGAAPRRDAPAGGGAPAQQEPQNRPASEQTSAPLAGSQAITLVPQAQAPTAAPPKYTGELVSMNLKDVDLKDFFRMIHEVSGLNIVVDSGVSGSVTMVLDRVPWDQALDLVLRDNSLGKVLEGNVLRIAKLETLEKEQEDSAKLADARQGAEPLVTVIIPLKYASAIDRMPTQATISSVGGAGGGMGGGGGGATSQQQNIIIPGVVSILTGHVSSGGSSGGGGLSQGRSVLSPRGSAIPDTRNNSIILTEVPSRIALIESVIAKLDTPAKQVSIEARIVVANSDFVRSFQSALNFGSVNPSGTTVTGGATGTGATAQGNVPPSTSSGGTSPPRVSIGQTAASGFGAFAISNQSLRYFINAAISAAETRDQAKVISSPTVVTQNNWPAVVMQGVQIPIQTTINNTISTQFVDAALTLQVTPTVTEGGHLFLQLSVANNSVGAVLTGAAGPSINTQAATTQVMVPDGGTVVFGGVKVTSRTRSVTQVPVVGGIPLLGNLFKSSNLEDNDQELLFFVSPKILPE